MKTKKRLKQISQQLSDREFDMRETLRLLRALCIHFKISTRLGGLSLTSFDKILKAQYPAEGLGAWLPSPAAIDEAKKFIDTERHIDKVEEAATQTITETFEYKEPVNKNLEEIANKYKALAEVNERLGF